MGCGRTTKKPDPTGSNKGLRTHPFLSLTAVTNIDQREFLAREID